MKVGKDYGIYTLQALMNQWSHAGVYFSQKHGKRIVAARSAGDAMNLLSMLYFPQQQSLSIDVWVRFCSLLCLRNRFKAENKQPVLTDFSEHMCAREIAT